VALEDLKHAQRERLIFLDRCLTWRGLANRRDLMQRFGISSAQAALDFRLYLKRTPTPPVYDTARKTYVATENHRALAPGSLVDAFDILASNGEGDGLPAALPAPPRHADPAIIARLYRAMTDGHALNIAYTSMTTGEDDGQFIAPTAFTSDGESVHLRAFSFKHAAYRNYLPIRIGVGSSFASRPLAGTLPFDADWHTLAEIELAPRSGLSAAQAAAVRREYGFDGPVLSIRTRKALEYYFDRRWGLDLAAARLERVATRYHPIEAA